MKKLYIAILLSITITNLKAQFAYSLETSYNLAGTYTDLGSTGTVITTANMDDANSAAQAIGFNFTYNGTVYTHFILNTNGFVKLGTSAAMTAPSSANLAYTYFNQNNFGGVFNSLSANDINILSAFNHDLDASVTATTEYRFATTGSSGSRVCTIQYKNVKDKNILDSSGSPLPHVQFNAMNFQIKMYESNKMIEFVYGNFIPSNDTCLFKLAGVGIVGNGPSQMISATKSSSHEYHLAQFQLGNYAASTPTLGFGFGNYNFRIGKTIPTYVIRPLPDAGRIIRFLPKISNDASVSLIYTKHASVIPYSSPHTIVARVSNVGTASMTGIWVKVSITGANSYSDSTFLASLASASASNVTFNGFTPQNLGNHTVRISLSNDGEVLNNSLTWLQKVSNYEIGYGDSSGVFSNFGWSSGSGIFASKYHVDGKRRIAKVRAKIGFNVANVGATVYGIVVDNSTNIIGRSDDYIITANDLAEWVEFDIHAGTTITPTTSPPPVLTNADFFAGLAVPGAGYYPMSLQLENPNRTGAYFYHGGITSGGAYTDIAITAGLERFRFGLNAQLDGTSLRLEPVTSFSNPSCATANQSVSVTVTNLDSLTVDFSRDTLHLQVSSTGAITQSFSNVINTGTLAKNASATFLITNSFDLSAGGTYNVLVEARQYMEVDTINNYKSILVNVVDTPGVSIKATPDSVVCYGTTQVFIALPYTAGSKTYQWKVNGVNQGSPTIDSTFTPALVWGDRVSADLITNHCTTGTFTIPSNEIIAKINPAPRLINGITDTDTVIEFTNKNYAIGVNPGHAYLWKVSGGTFTGDSTGSAITVTWGGPNTSAFVSVKETDSKSCQYDNVLPVVIISIVGLDEIAGLYIGEAYPNPADQSISIPIVAEKETEIELTVFDMTGRIIRELFKGSVSGGKTFTMSTGELSEGSYYFKLKTSGGFNKTGRFTISH